MERAIFLDLSSRPAERTNGLGRSWARSSLLTSVTSYEEESDDDLMNIKCPDNGTTPFCKILSYTSFKKVFDAWCERRSKRATRLPSGSRATVWSQQTHLIW